jgi:cyclic pyranopterin phosphate synthase
MREKTSMVDVTAKPEVTRSATAEGVIRLKAETIRAINEHRVTKGDVLTTAELAAINAVKKTSDMVFLAHPIPITAVKATLDVDAETATITATVTVQSLGRTGVEIEALMGVMTALLTVFDMCKYLEKDDTGQYPVTQISDVKVLRKRKG